MEKTKKTADRTGVMRAVVFILLFFVLFHCVSVVLEEKRYRDSMAAFYAEPKNSLDVLLMGSSHLHNGVSAVQLEEEYGVRVNNFAQNGQVLSQTWYALQEALRYQEPKVVVLDVYKVVQDSLINSPVAMHYTADFMRVGLPKLRMIRDLMPRGERAEYLFDVIAYHTRWKELTDADFAPPDTSRKGTETLTGHYVPYDGWQVLPESVKAPAAEIELYYLDRIVELCRAEDIELLLVSVPFTTPEHDELNRQAVLNGMADYAGEKGLTYLNLMHHVDEMGLDFRTDMADMYHVNAQGMEKVTAYIGAYLTEHYEFA
ncbi:MAG: hypothetical protein IK136_03120 [Oscillospiraceae bacterium]|nr:hypothetical protein [Oscillospiraceae bacterium]